MAYNPNGNSYRTAQAGYASASSAALLDQGLRAYMLRVYNWMASGLVLTGLVAYAISHTSLMNAFYPRLRPVPRRKASAAMATTPPRRASAGSASASCATTKSRR